MLLGFFRCFFRAEFTVEPVHQAPRQILIHIKPQLQVAYSTGWKVAALSLSPWLCWQAGHGTLLTDRGWAWEVPHRQVVDISQRMKGEGARYGEREAEREMTSRSGDHTEDKMAGSSLL